MPNWFPLAGYFCHGPFIPSSSPRPIDSFTIFFYALQQTPPSSSVIAFAVCIFSIQSFFYIFFCPTSSPTDQLDEVSMERARDQLGHFPSPASGAGSESEFDFFIYLFIHLFILTLYTGALLCNFRALRTPSLLGDAAAARFTCAISTNSCSDESCSRPSFFCCCSLTRVVFLLKFPCLHIGFTRDTLQQPPPPRRVHPNEKPVADDVASIQPATSNEKDFQSKNFGSILGVNKVFRCQTNDQHFQKLGHSSLECKCATPAALFSVVIVVIKHPYGGTIRYKCHEMLLSRWVGERSCPALLFINNMAVISEEKECFEWRMDFERT